MIAAKLNIWWDDNQGFLVHTSYMFMENGKHEQQSSFLWWGTGQENWFTLYIYGAILDNPRGILEQSRYVSTVKLSTTPFFLRTNYEKIDCCQTTPTSTITRPNLVSRSGFFFLLKFRMNIEATRLYSLLEGYRSLTCKGISLLIPVECTSIGKETPLFLEK